MQVNKHQSLRLVNICTLKHIILPAKYWYWHVLYRGQSCAELEEETSKTVPVGCWTGKVYKACNINLILLCKYWISLSCGHNTIQIIEKKISLKVTLKCQSLSTIVNHLKLYSILGFKKIPSCLNSTWSGVVRCRKRHLKRMHCSCVYKTHNIYQRASLFFRRNGDTQYISCFCF